MTRRAIRHLNVREHQPAIVYLHPWEIDATQPRVAELKIRSRVRHYMNLRAMPSRLTQLLQDFRWARMDEVFADYLVPVAAEQPAASSVTEVA